MNKDNAKDFLPLVQALADGKTVQVQGGDGNWYNSKLINIPPHRYRIKLEPRTFEMWRCTETTADYLEGEMIPDEGVEPPSYNNYNWERITVREVLQ